MSDRPEVLGEGRFLRFLSDAGWEYVERVNASGVAVVVAVTPAGELLLVEQYRRAVRRKVIELPAGLCGDLAGHEAEPLERGARRELEEETGWRARGMTRLVEGPTSAGMSCETIVLFRATDLEKVGEGGGDEHEEIAVHAVPLAEVPAFLDARVAEGMLVDPKVYAGLWFAGAPGPGAG